MIRPEYMAILPTYHSMYLASLPQTGGVPLPLPGPSPSLLARGVARFAVTRGQPLDQALEQGPSDSLFSSVDPVWYDYS
jgi:hypothetical protein